MLPPMDDPRLTKERISNARVIAKGHRIRDVERLVRVYGGRAGSWRKLSTSPFLASPGRWTELHWYEHHRIGRFEIKEVAVRI